MVEPAIRINALSKSYETRNDSRQVLEKVSLDVHKGDRIAFVGPNGSGKTTLLRILLGIDTADDGSVSLSPDLLQPIGYVPQDYRNALFPWLRLEKNLALAHVRSVEDELSDRSPAFPGRQSYSELSSLFRVALDLEKYPYQLSGGEQQIFLLIRSLLQQPKLLVLDEPLSAVDFGRRRLIQDFLGHWIQESGCILLFASHDFEEAVMLSNRVVVLCADSGKLKNIIEVDLPWPRKPEVKSSKRFAEIVNQIIASII